MSQIIFRRVAAAAGIALITVVGATGPAAASGGGSDDHGGKAHARTLLEADLVGSLTTDPVLFGVSPGGADWSRGRSTVELETDGRFEATVKKLVLTSTGVNPVTQLSVSLACNGAVVDTVGPVAFSTKGNAKVKGTFTLPARCLAPTVLVNPVDRVGVYIAVSGSVR